MIWNVSVPQAIGWSQIEISLAIILACAPMSAKLVLHPLDTEQYLVRMGTVRLSQVDTSTLIDKNTKTSESDQLRLGSISSMHGAYPTVKLEVPGGGIGSQERLPVVTRGPDGMVVLEEGATPREIHSPDYQKLKVVRAEVDGRMVWEVRSATPETSV